MNALITEKSKLIQLINRGGYGYFRLENEAGTTTYGVYPVGSEVKAATRTIVDQLEELFGLLGQGSFRLTLKTQSKAPDTQKTTYYYSNLPKQGGSNVQGMNSSMGFNSPAQMQQFLDQQVQIRGLEQEKVQADKLQLEKERNELEISKLKLKLSGGKSNNAQWDMITNIALLIGVPIAEKLAPGTGEKIIAGISAAKGMADDSEEEEYEVPQKD